MNMHPAAKPAGYGALAFSLLLGAHFALLTLASGWGFTVSHYSDFWYYILPLGAGFGLQVALYSRLRQLARPSMQARAVMTASGTTASMAMVSCCAYYLLNVAPVLVATGLVAFASQYEVELFWVGLAFNAAGVAFTGSRLWKASKESPRCAHP